MKKIPLVLTPALLLINNLLSAAPTIDEQRNYYPIHGSNSQELRAQMNTYGPLVKGKHFDGQVKWYVHWNYHWFHDLGKQNCAITSVDVSVLIQHSIPQWENAAESDKETQDKWRNYLSHLELHESGHATNGKQAAEDIEKALLSTAPKPSCDQLKNELDTTAQNLIKQHEAWDVEYDAKTEHGRSQGAVFP